MWYVGLRETVPLKLISLRKIVGMYANMRYASKVIARSVPNFPNTLNVTFSAFRDLPNF
jgi:hypothetical protein